MEETIRFRAVAEHTVTVENVCCTVRPEWPSENPHLRLSMLTDHSHSHTELFACLRGHVCLGGNADAVLTAGDIAVVPSAYPHRCMPDDGTEWLSVSFLCVRRRGGSADLMRKLEPITDSASIYVFRDAPRFCASLNELQTDMKTDSGYLSALRFLEILLRLAERDHRPQKEFPPGSGLDRMTRLDSLVNDYYMTDFTAERAAEMLCISTRQLSRIVHMRYGASLGAVIREKRAATAAHLLTDTAESIDEIGAEVGFGSRAAFYRAFREVTGLTPAAYRRMKQTKE